MLSRKKGGSTFPLMSKNKDLNVVIIIDQDVEVRWRGWISCTKIMLYFIHSYCFIMICKINTKYGLLIINKSFCVSVGNLHGWLDKSWILNLVSKGENNGAVFGLSPLHILLGKDYQLFSHIQCTSIQTLSLLATFFIKLLAIYLISF